VADERAPVRLKVHPGMCNGWGQCWRFAPEVYWLDEDGYVDFVIVEVPAELAEAARRGAEACPEQAITVIEVAAPVR
jgi:ferredoxin